MEMRLIKTKSEFNSFIKELSQLIKKLELLVSTYYDENILLNSDYDKIDLIQEFYHDYYYNNKDLGIPFEEVTKMFWAYIGEAFISHCGGTWRLADKRDEAYDTPVIYYGADENKLTRISPYIWGDAILDNDLHKPLSEIVRSINGENK